MQDSLFDKIVYLSIEHAVSVENAVSLTFSMTLARSCSSSLLPPLSLLSLDIPSLFFLSPSGALLSHSLALLLQLCQRRLRRRRRRRRPLMSRPLISPHVASPHLARSAGPRDAIHRAEGPGRVAASGPRQPPFRRAAPFGGRSGGRPRPAGVEAHPSRGPPGPPCGAHHASCAPLQDISVTPDRGPPLSPGAPPTLPSPPPSPPPRPPPSPRPSLRPTARALRSGRVRRAGWSSIDRWRRGIHSPRGLSHAG